jgi:acetolactate decarboxylase
MKSNTSNLPESLYEALQHRMKTDNASLDHVVTAALSRCMGKPIHTLLQVPLPLH